MIYIENSDKKYLNGERTTKQSFLNIIKVEYQHLSNKCTYHSNLTEKHVLFFVESGNVFLNNKKVPSGNVLNVSQFSKFQLNTPDSANLIEITYDYSDDIPLFNENIRIIKPTFEITEYIKKIYENCFLSNSISGINEGLLLNVLNTLNNLCDFRSAELSLYQKCRKCIEKNSVSNINAQITANAMNCTVAHLNRTVKKYSGKCLNDIVTETRLTEIKRLIRNSTFSTKDIAQKLDFGSPELLRKFFKYHTGISLNEYKKQCYKI